MEKVMSFKEEMEVVAGVCTYVVLTDISNYWSVIYSPGYVPFMKTLSKFYVYVYFRNMYTI